MFFCFTAVQETPVCSVPRPHSPSISSFLLVVARRTHVLKVAAPRRLRGRADHPDLRLCPFEAEQIAADLAVHLAPLVAGRVAPLAADGRAFFHQMQVAVRRAEKYCRPLAPFRHVAGLWNGVRRPYRHPPPQATTHAKGAERGKPSDRDRVIPREPNMRRPYHAFRGRKWWVFAPGCRCEIWSGKIAV